MLPTNVVVDGDFAVTENQLRTALKSLREAGIAGTHSHMTGEEPRIIFFNYCARGPAQSLAQVFRRLCLLEIKIPAKPRPNVR
jgi:hypothetical protein